MELGESNLPKPLYYVLVGTISPMEGNTEETMEQTTYLQSRFKEVKKWYNGNAELKEK